MTTPQDCPNCRDREVEELRSDLHKCKKTRQSQERKINQLNKKVFVCTIIGVAIAAIFGKEVLDSITEWIGSVRNFNTTTLGDLVFPSPGALGFFVLAGLTGRTRRRS